MGEEVASIRGNDCAGCQRMGADDAATGGAAETGTVLHAAGAGGRLPPGFGAVRHCGPHVA